MAGMRVGYAAAIWMAFGAALVPLTKAQAEDDTEVLQVKQAFDPKSITVAAGAPVRFVNGDDVKHNLQAVAPDGTRTDYGVAPPGQVTPITFATAGDYTVVCGIHPRMKLKVSVHP